MRRKLHEIIPNYIHVYYCKLNLEKKLIGIYANRNQVTFNNLKVKIVPDSELLLSSCYFAVIFRSIHIFRTILP